MSGRYSSCPRVDLGSVGRQHSLLLTDNKNWYLKTPPNNVSLSTDYVLLLPLDLCLLLRHRLPRMKSLLPDLFGPLLDCKSDSRLQTLPRTVHYVPSLTFVCFQDSDLP